MAPAVPGPTPPPADGYIAFSADRFRRARRTTPPPAAAVASAPLRVVPAAPTRTGATSDWAHLLRWSREATGARQAFLIDASGLLVGSDGPLDDVQAEAMGARLVLTLEQVDQLDPGLDSARAVAAQLSDGWLWGVRVSKEAGTWLALGLLLPEPPDAALQRIVPAAFAGTSIHR